MTDPLDTKKIRLLLADYDDTIRRYESGLLVSDNYYHGLQTAIIKHAPALLDEIETLSDHVLQLQGGWAHEGNQSLAEIERLTAENEKLNGLVGVNPRTLEHEINRLTAENEELRGALRDLQAILCDPEGTPCFAGSDGDREVARLALAKLEGGVKP